LAKYDYDLQLKTEQLDERMLRKKVSSDAFYPPFVWPD